MHTNDWEPLLCNLSRAVLDGAENADSFQTAVIVTNLTFSMPTISQGQVRLQFMAAVLNQDGTVVIADACCSC